MVNKNKKNFSFKLIFFTSYRFFYFLIVKLIPNIIKHFYYILRFLMKKLTYAITFVFAVFKSYKKNFKICWQRAKEEKKVYSPYFFVNLLKKLFYVGLDTSKQVMLDLKITISPVTFLGYVCLGFAIKGIFTMYLLDRFIKPVMFYV
jgi:hypothetical protein